MLNLLQNHVLKNTSCICSKIFHAFLRRLEFVSDVATGGCLAILMLVSIRVF